MRIWEWVTVKAWISAVAAGCAAAATSYLLWAQFYPKSDSKTLVTLSIAVVGGVGIVSSLARPVRIVVFGNIEQAKAKVGPALRALAWAAHSAAQEQVDVRELGASAWVVGGIWPRRKLVRVGRERYHAHPGPSQIRWTKGKGYIGRCWETGRPQVGNPAAFDREQKTCSSDDCWNAIPEERRMKLSFREYEKIRGKYGTVIAVAVVDGRKNHKVIGVVTLDAPPGHHRQLNRPAVIEEVSKTAIAVATFLT